MNLWQKQSMVHFLKEKTREKEILSRKNEILSH